MIDYCKYNCHTIADTETPSYLKSMLLTLTINVWSYHYWYRGSIVSPQWKLKFARLLLTCTNQKIQLVWVSRFEMDTSPFAHKLQLPSLPKSNTLLGVITNRIEMIVKSSISSIPLELKVYFNLKSTKNIKQSWFVF